MSSRKITPTQLSLFSRSPIVGAWWEELKAQGLFKDQRPEDSELDKYLKGENLFNSYANNNLGFHQVSKKVNNPLNDGPELIHKI